MVDVCEIYTIDCHRTINTNKNVCVLLREIMFVIVVLNNTYVCDGFECRDTLSVLFVGHGV